MSKDPYRYFRVEARELAEGLGAGVLELERGGPAVELVGRLLRLAHTLKGAARVVRQLEIAEAAHAIEEVLGGRKEAGGSFTKEEISALLASVDRIGDRLSALAAPAPAPAVVPAKQEPGARAPDEPFRSVRIEIQEMDALLAAIAETDVQLAALRGQAVALEKLAALAGLLVERFGAPGSGPKAPLGERERGLANELQVGVETLGRAIGNGVERVAQELEDVRQGADRLRLVPADVLLAPLVRAARDAGETLGKDVAVALSGGALRLDAHALGPLRDALVQLVRNAVAHGIEPRLERTKAGKQAAGAVRIELERSGQRVLIRCRDDGRGIDVAAVRRELVLRGVHKQADADALSDSAVYEALLSSGLSTAHATTEIAGRGIGLGLVREVAVRLKGEIRVESERGRGTTIELAIPVSLAAVTALHVKAGPIAAAIPLDSVRRTLRVKPGELARSARGESVVHEGRLIPFVPLAEALRVETGTDDRARAWSAVVVGAGERLAAVGVDRLGGTSEVVVRGLPAVIDADPLVAGAALDLSGNPELVLDAPGLVAAAENARAGTPETRAPLPPILVIDDSLTTRMLEQSILESAGYEVELAVSAEQALEMARGRRYGVFIVDVEMPGMDGFEFVTRTRADPALSETPAILVSSRNSAEDLARGERAGASAYIVKGEFDQRRLLDTLRKLLG